MRHPLTLSHGLLLVPCLLLLACGGGSTGAPAEGPPGPPATVLGVVHAVLLGTGPTSVVDPDARGSVFLEVLSDGRVDYACTVDAAYEADVDGVRIRQGAAGADGPVVATLVASAGAFDGATHTATGQVTVDATLAGGLTTAPGDYYVEATTPAAPGGLVREQLASLVAWDLHALLLGTEEVAVADPAARGAATLRVESDRTAGWRIGTRAPAAADLTLGHLHAGPAGVDGPIVVDLDVASSVPDPSTGLLAGSATLGLDVLARLAHDLDAFYVNVHTAAAPGGVARGQLTDGPVHLWAELTAGEETLPPTDPTARGGMTLQLRSFEEGTAHLAVPPAQGILGVVSAHVHDGAAGVDGPIVIDLMAGSDFIQSAPSFSSEGTVACTQDLFTRILADPAAFYANFHTASDPAGVARGQLSQDAVTFLAVMDGTQETTVVDPTAAGTLSLVVTDVFRASFTLEMVQPPAGDLTAAHVHDGAPGTDGPALIDLLGGEDVVVAPPFVTGVAPFTGRTFARLLAVPERFYANVHTALAPDGVARGQLQEQSSALPPAGLTYTTPVSYAEQSPIASNVPSSVGGAPTSYSVAPALPAGLSLDPNTGVISGTPTVPTAAADYTVTASNAAGSAMAAVNIEIVPISPTNLVYLSPVDYTAGSAIAPNTPTHDGGTVASYGVSPALPAGLTLNPTTGVLSGTPTTPTAAADYTVTASNTAGSATFAINITISAVLQAPSGLSYTTPVTYGTGSAITPNTPTIGGGAVSTWAIAPALPAGLAFSTSTGVISGTPTTITAAANYTVTASNAAGSTTAAVNITIVLGAPTNLSYTNDPNIAYVGTAISAMNPSSQGGTVASYSITPALPTGLSLNTTTGVISGTPTSTSSFTSYTVTATNAAGSTTATVQIVVY